MDGNRNKETFKVLDGAQVDYGGRYEYLMTAYVSMKLLRDPTVAYFKLSNNHEEFGKFDDLVIEVTLCNGQTETWAVQLKHSKSGKAISKNELAAEGKGDFCIAKYFRDCKKRQYPGNTKLVLYTNRQLDEEKQFDLFKQPVKTTRQSTGSSFMETSAKGCVYQLEIHGETTTTTTTTDLLDEYKQFFANFYIYANQKNVEQIENDIAQFFADVYRSDGQEKYKKYFETWCRKEPIEGCKDKLYRDDVVFELQRILLQPYVRPVVPVQCDAKGTLLKMVIAKFDVTLVKEDWQKYVEHLWTPCEEHCDGAPLIVKVNRYNVGTVCKAIDLYKRSFVLIGDLELNNSNNLNTLNNLSIFQNLCDLDEDDYNEVTAQLRCVVQGRPSECLANIFTGGVSDELKRCFEVGHLLKIVGNETLVIGDETVQLPMAYINRSIPKHIFSLDLIKNVGNNDVLVISCGTSCNFATLQQTVSDLKHVRTKIATSIVAIESPSVILLRHKCSSDEFVEICSKSDNVYCFEMLGNCLSLLNSHGNLSNLLKYREAASGELTVPDWDVLNNFMNKTNVLLGDPGMGKTICADFIKRICPFDLWPVKVNLREKLELFLTSNCDGLLTGVLDPFDLARFRNCYGSKVLFIWDGLDEVDTKDVDKILEQVQELSRRGYVQWITSRCHLKDKLEKSLSVISINLVEITVDDQRNYLETRLSATYERIDEVTARIHERIVQNKLKDFLGIPLLLFMFTEICLDPVKYQLILENEITLIQIYRLFIDGKFDHFNQKVMKSENALFSKIEDEIKDYRTVKYQKAALRTCFDDAFLDKLEANCDKFLEKIDKDGDVYGIITRIGDGNTPIFIHKCFAEYFAAWYLTRKHHKIDKEILKRLFQEGYKNIRFLFDLLLSENCPAHQAVLELNLDKLKNIPASLIFGHQDNGGRNVFHLVSSYGARRMPLHRIGSIKPRFGFGRKNLDTFDSAPLDSSERENKDYEQIVKFLLGLVENLDDLLYSDKIYGLDFVEYANISLSLYAIDAYSKPLKFKLIDNYKDNETVLAYSVLFNYTNLFGKLQDIPYFVLDRLSKPARASGFQHFDKYDVVILMIEHERNDMLQKTVKCFGNRINQAMFNDENSLSWAVRKGNLNIVKLLVRNKVDASRVHAMNNNILHIAVAQRQTEIVDYMVGKKLVQIDARNSSGETPLLIAAKLGHFRMAKRLIASGAKIDAKNAYGENLLHVACKSGNVELVQHLLTLDHRLGDLLLEQSDSFGNTPLLTAARAKDLRIYVLLIDAGADLCVKNVMGWNILHCACSSGSFDFIRMLSRYRLIELDTRDASSPKDTPMLVAARNGHFDMVEYLLDMRAADFSAQNSHRKNVLHYACQHGHLEFVKAELLSEHLADLGNVADSDGHVPLFYADKRGHSEIVEYLKGIMHQ